MEHILALDNVIAAVLGLISGVIGSLIAPWVHWGIEKRQTRRAARYELMHEARAYVMSKQFGIVQYTKKDHYYTLRQEFSKKAVARFDELLDQTTKGQNVASNRESARQIVLKEICRTEKKWFLI
ncbi:MULTISPECIES: hypothetical protein [Vibrio]|uniref:hypothetical protein n=1 Tax=Vibrio TaxID=662 RepID=UPI00111D928E|nr:MULTISPECIES: hypothetical protein [Vibrio]TNZ03594.1 hypothetical protein CGK58_19870 [Vibrio parahaemolyticus]USD33638.1 hypothetical protein J8Z27_05905 [Vibrio sp. SCSIO 43186]USD46706.1 hypothetical protein J4N38_06080 [Vibrio sp. SCSIO 43145]USD70763.1 hypothetical protein J4N41_05905 [Vibrio sp. SCSIO 43139]USD95681.1 hypothetical protein CTT30_05990 [Vibrio coralliilyticus]